MDLVKLGQAADYLVRCGLNVYAKPEAMFLGAEDTNGTVYEYYVEEQKACFINADTKLVRTVENFPIQKFAYVCKHPEALKW